MKSDVDECFAELYPVLDEIARFVKSAPLDNKDRAGLAVLVAGHSFGVAIGSLEQAGEKAIGAGPNPDIARQLAEMLVSLVERGPGKPQ